MAEGGELQQSWRARLSKCIRDWLILPKLLYFSLNMAVYSTYYFTSNFFEAVWHIPIHSYGFISGLTTLGFFGSIFWTMIADRTGRHKLILIFAALGFAASFCLLRLNNGGPDVEFWKRMLYVSFAYGLSNFFASALYPLLDNRIFSMLIQNPDFSTKLYGKQRLWGSIGQAVITLINGKGISTALGYDIMFINVTWSTLLFIFFVLLGIPSSSRSQASKKETKPLVKRVEGDDSSTSTKEDMIPLDSTIVSPASIKSQQRSASVLRPALLLLSNFHFILFIALVLAAGYVRSILGHFLIYYFDRTVQQDPLLYTLAMQTRLVSEISLFFLGRPLLNRLGAFWMMMLGLVAGTVRVAGYALIPPTLKWANTAFLLEFLKGVNNACIITAGVRIAHSLAPEGCETTAQGFFSGIQSNLANAIAGFVGGIILKWYEGDRLSLQKLFGHTSIFSGVACLAYGLLQYFWPFPDDQS